MHFTFNLKILNKLCTPTEHELKRRFLSEGFTENNGSLFLDNKSPILAVAHLDCVHGRFACAETISLPDETLFFHPRLDDRLGVYTILHLLPQMGINVDILFTFDEESACSTGGQFDAPKKYHWLVEFDRRGSDVVMYEYLHDQPLTSDLKTVGWTPGHGLYSDISDMEHLGVGAFNVGTGYHREHTDSCFFSVRELTAQLGKFFQFWKRFKDKSYVHVPTPKTRSGYESYARGAWWNFKNQGGENECSTLLYLSQVCAATHEGRRASKRISGAQKTTKKKHRKGGQYGLIALGDDVMCRPYGTTTMLRGTVEDSDQECQYYGVQLDNGTYVWVTAKEIYLI